MRKPTKAELIETADHESKRADVCGLALHLVMTSKPDASETVREGKEVYVCTVYGSTRCDGGVLIRRFVYPGQTDTIEASRWLEWEQSTRGMGRNGGVYLKLAFAAERLRRTITCAQCA